MKNIKIIITILVILLTAILIVRYWDKGGTLPAKTEPTVTQVMRFVPPEILPTETQEGSCWTSSIAAPYRADAFRCTIGNEIQDPCFTITGVDEMLCGVNPAQGTQGFVLKLAKPLPVPEVPPGETPSNWAWSFMLGDGTYCTPFTGTRPFVNNEAGFYGCTGSTGEKQVMIMGDIDNNNPLWTAKKAIVVRDGANWKVQSEDIVPVKVVWQ